ncbi:MAG TPA: heavy metal translocating P-type ATPase, partial [Gammaproteobacteria bacterium]|nr:heavy metal translocating P-type ATPase [Gammaproteobacteria bacterium]
MSDREQAPPNPLTERLSPLSSMTPHSLCFHCGLPLPAGEAPSLDFSGEQRRFCCEGCKSVCRAIIDSGNGDYYRYREQTAKTTDARELARLLSRFNLYDNPEVQKDFIREGESWREAWLILEEIRCAACLWLNERTLRRLDGVIDVQMDYTAQQARVRWDPDRLQLSEILSAIAAIGYVAHPFDPRYREALNEEMRQRSDKRIIFAAILGMVVMQTAIGSYFFGAPVEGKGYPLWITLSRWSSLLATGAILAYPGQTFFRNAWRDIRNRSAGMDAPVALGLGLAWLGSLWATVTGQGEVYYESIAMFVLFILLARRLELRARIEATALLDRLGRVIPATARRITDQGVSEVAVVELRPGDRIALSPGETVPVDGQLLSPRSSFDESLLSGEAKPVTHVEGDEIVGGAINIEQPIEIEVGRASRDSTLAQLQQLARKSLASKPSYVDLAEKVAGKFVAAILLLAALTVAFWAWVDPAHALGRGIAVLIVTCPCALALASPVALSLCASGLNRFHMAALRMASIETVHQVDTVALDKTGTLTTGKPEVAGVLPLRSLDRDRLLRIAAAMEKGSEHPFAHALKTAAEGLPPIEATAIVHHPGEGVEAMIEGERWRLGGEAFALGAPNGAVDAGAAEGLRKQGLSVLCLSNGEGPQALFSIADPLREGVDAFLRAVRQPWAPSFPEKLWRLIRPGSRGRDGRRVVILSGDHPDSVQAVGDRLGVDMALGGLTPEKKLAWLRREQRRGHRLMMVGDGVNDAPVLAAADVSMAFSDAT